MNQGNTLKELGHKKQESQMNISRQRMNHRNRLYLCYGRYSYFKVNNVTLVIVLVTAVLQAYPAATKIVGLYCRSSKKRFLKPSIIQGQYD
jgi:hypothetical protein